MRIISNTEAIKAHLRVPVGLCVPGVVITWTKQIKSVVEQEPAGLAAKGETTHIQPQSLP